MKNLCPSKFGEKGSNCISVVCRKKPLHKSSSSIKLTSKLIAEKLIIMNEAMNLHSRNIF